MVHYYFALGILMLLILAAMPWAIVGLSNQLGRCAATDTAATAAKRVATQKRMRVCQLSCAHAQTYRICS